MSLIKDYINVLSTDYLFDEIVEDLLRASGEKIDITFKSECIMKAFYVPSLQETIRYAALPMAPKLYSKHAIFFRVRKIESTEYKYNINDFWEPPEDVIRPGRLNKNKEKMLYCSVNDVETALKEARINVGDTYIVVFYLLNDDISVNGIGFDRQIDMLKTVNEYFGKSGDSAYKLSEKLAKNLYRLDHCDGWCYPSVLKENGINICLNLSAKDKLDLIAVHELKKYEESDCLLSILDINGIDSVSRLNDWDNPNGQAHLALKQFEDNCEKWNQSNLQHHKKNNADIQNHYIPTTVNFIPAR